MWVLADTNGYVGGFDVYSGKKANAVERGLGANVVLSLTQSLCLPGSTMCTSITSSPASTSSSTFTDLAFMGVVL